jgi:hypothetical protein
MRRSHWKAGPRLVYLALTTMIAMTVVAGAVARRNTTFPKVK